MRTYRFVVGDLPFDCELPEALEVAKVLPSFGPFFQKEPSGEADFKMTAVDSIEDEADWIPSEQFCNDLGAVQLYRKGKLFLVELGYPSTEEKERLWMDVENGIARVSVNWESSYAAQALTSMARIMYSQRVLLRKGFSIHASTVIKEGVAYLFLGKSGTGKSTHSRWWMQEWPEVELLNDDNPIVRIVDEQIWVYGSPWSGKTPCYKQKRVPLKGLVRLEQAPMNQWTTVKGVKAWAAVFPSCAVMMEDSCLYQALQETLDRVVSQVKVGRLKCLPNGEAARLSEHNLK